MGGRGRLKNVWQICVEEFDEIKMAHTRDIDGSNDIGGMSRKNRNERKVNKNRQNLGVKMG